MAWAYRTGSYANDGTGFPNVVSGGTTTITLGAAVSSGDLLVLHIIAASTLSNPAPTFSVSDSVNGAWSNEDVTNTFAGSHNARHSIWTFPNSAAGTPVLTITITGSGSYFGGCEVAAFSGIATASALDTKSAASGTSSSPSSGAVSPSTGAANELMVGVYVDEGFGTTLSAGNINAVSATLAGKHDADGNNYQALFEYGDSGSSGGTPSATASSSGSITWSMLAAVYKLSGGGGGGTAVVPEMRTLRGAGL